MGLKRELLRKGVGGGGGGGDSSLLYQIFIKKRNVKMISNLFEI